MKWPQAGCVPCVKSTALCLFSFSNLDIFYLIGVLGLLILCRKEVVRMAILVLGFSDKAFSFLPLNILLALGLSQLLLH